MIVYCGLSTSSNNLKSWNKDRPITITHDQLSLQTIHNHNPQYPINHSLHEDTIKSTFGRAFPMAPPLTEAVPNAEERNSFGGAAAGFLRVSQSCKNMALHCHSLYENHTFLFHIVICLLIFFSKSSSRPQIPNRSHRPWIGVGWVSAKGCCR